MDAADEDHINVPKRCRVFIPNKRKVEICNKLRRGRRLDANFSLKKLARDEDVDPSQLRRWMKQMPTLLQACHDSKKSKFSVHFGRKTTFPKADDLVDKIMELRESGMPVSTNMAVIMACQMDNNLRRKSSTAKYAIIRRILRAKGIVIRSKTHEAQTHPREKQEEAKQFVQSVLPLIQQPCRHKDFIANMDQTPVFFSMTPNTTLETQGSRSVHVRASSGSTMRVTLAVFVTANGEMLPPYMVYKGKANGRINREFTDDKNDYPKDCFYAAQPKAWMDERICLEWAEKVVKPWAQKAPEGITPLLFLDSYKCHLMSSVNTAIEELGVEVEYIPGGCTSLCQPVDVGINKPLKNRIRAAWEQYMLEEGLAQDKTTPPSRPTIAKWCDMALKELDGDIIRHAWRHGEYSFFPGEVAPSTPTETIQELEDSMQELSLSSDSISID